VLSGATLAAIVQWAATRLGEAALIPPPTWGATLFFLGAIVVGLAWPVRKSVHHPASGAVDSQYATRVVLLAKASAVTGAGLVGAALGLGLFFLSRPVVSIPALWWVGVAMLGAVVLTVGGLVAERWCSYPPEGKDTPGQQQPEGEPS